MQKTKPSKIEPGTRFGYMTVDRKAPRHQWAGYHAEYYCVCDCGTKKKVRGANLTHGNTKSCSPTCYSRLTKARLAAQNGASKPRDLSRPVDALQAVVDAQKASINRMSARTRALEHSLEQATTDLTAANRERQEALAKLESQRKHYETMIKIRDDENQRIEDYYDARCRRYGVMTGVVFVAGGLLGWLL